MNVAFAVGFDKCIMTCVYQYSTIQNSFAALKILLALPIHLPFPSPSLILLLSLFQNATYLETSQYVAFSDWLLSLSNMHIRFIHVFLWLDISCPFSAE